jgi:ABC-type lipopolysaccharide export system ATPase subunit
MLAGVEILLERMKTNPEEFVEEAISKWAIVLSNVSGVLNDEELKALEEALKELKRNHFNGEVMRVLAGDVEETTDLQERIYEVTKGKRLMQGSAIKLINAEFDKEYAKTKAPRTPHR